ncbi:MAG: L-aspartate oxidase [Candidatus Obscuribacterales bacterium]|nr:L-aspartate oxidase [Candidatus Obscuribacterales bacterium]
MTSTTDSLKFDSLVVGSGLAGLLSALELANQGQSVALVSKGALVESNTSWAQGGLAAVTPASFLDSPEKHFQDTIKSGAGLTDQLTAWLIIRDGAKLVEKLGQLGVNFDIRENKTFDLALEGGHRQPRVLHCKDTTGRSITTALAEHVRSHANITVLEHCAALDLIVQENNCLGAYFINGKSTITILANNTLLASGGIGQVFSRTTNPLVATGDGIAMAYRAGAALADMEFVQFHPTALFVKDAPAFLISEAVRGAGAILTDDNEEPFMHRFHENGELATRDIVARAIHTTIRRQAKPYVYLDMRPIGIEKLAERFPHIINNCRHWGIDPLIQPVPVAPAAHYFMGGILTNVDGQTSVDNLYAIGECAANGLHGANRLASNSLLEAGVMAIRVTQCIAKNVSRTTKTHTIGPARKLMAAPLDAEKLKESLYKNAGIVRNAESLTELASSLFQESMLAPRNTVAQAESANMLIMGKLIARAALLRTESRGAHYRADHPQDDERMKQRLIVMNGKWSWLEPKAISLDDDCASPQIQPVAQPLAGDVFAIAQAKKEKNTNRHRPQGTSPKHS